MYAVIKTGGKQYRVAEGDKLVIEKLEGEAGDTVAFDEVLMLGGEDGVTVGSPTVEGAQVMGELVDVRKGKKVLVFKKRRRQNYRRTKGHRQWQAVVSISEIVMPGAKPKTKASAKPKAEKAEPAAKTAEKSAPTPAASKKAAAGDDLKALTGIGPALEQKLIEAGVTSYAQIASWTEADLDRLDAEISGLKAKAEKGDWINEAKGLAGK
ncbi:50S ribosomal protein L21 [Marinicauda algicola]|uniref:Large ribosomal subunit protein bL21 n=1 Tax=Marinicauda algicola TaxID=2029849 RepID=A0A4S2H0Y8_9PROT|nr:50S ribosomal protein L21 [Marinicauda algicola]TGY88812.1 50S ribosomal protein L21 [Marinicauda algicola]